ncbi:MAG: M48 family metallopeptidase [Firmicutes bacterium]|nr:M48 family metallopeptidase [Bacillota bacterium]
MNTKIQERTVCAGEKNIKYILERKQVKNINMRVRPDGSVRVSAGPWADASQIDDFVLSKAEFILKAMKRFENMAEAEEKYQEELVKAKAGRESLLADVSLFTEILDEFYPLFVPYGVKKPKLRVRTMKSCWGSCLVNKGIITLNRKLLMKPRECIEYVVVHELCHFIHPNHSKQFYGFMEQFMPDWKERKARLNERT